MESYLIIIGTTAWMLLVVAAYIKFDRWLTVFTAGDRYGD